MFGVEKTLDFFQNDFVINQKGFPIISISSTFRTLKSTPNEKIPANSKITIFVYFCCTSICYNASNRLKTIKYFYTGTTVKPRRTSLFLIIVVSIILTVVQIITSYIFVCMSFHQFLTNVYVLQTPVNSRKYTCQCCSVFENNCLQLCI